MNFKLFYCRAVPDLWAEGRTNAANEKWKFSYRRADLGVVEGGFGVVSDSIRRLGRPCGRKGICIRDGRTLGAAGKSDGALSVSQPSFVLLLDPKGSHNRPLSVIRQMDIRIEGWRGDLSMERLKFR